MSRAAALALLGALLVGCSLGRPPEKREVNCYLADTRDLVNVRRIMVLPFGEEPGVAAELSRVRDAYVAELQKLRRFEVVPLPGDASEAELLNQSIRHGRISTDAIVELCNRYRLDGVMVGAVTAYRAYTPPQLGMRTQLVSVHSGSVIWAVDAIYDASDRSMQSDLRHYFEGHQADDGNLHGWEFELLSPSRFCAYVAHRFVGTWIEDA
jgi:hypothetical protein